MQERREQKIAEKNESRETVPRTGVETNTAVKDAGESRKKDSGTEKGNGKEREKTIDS